MIELMSPIGYHAPKDMQLTDKELKIEVVVSPKKSGETLQQFLTSQTEKNQKYVVVQLNGIEAYKVDWSGMGSGTNYFLLHNDKRYIITKYPQQTERDAEFDQILSTFKLTSSTADIPDQTALISMLKTTIDESFPPDKVIINITKTEGNYAMGTVRFMTEEDGGPGGVWFAAFINGKWAYVDGGQSPPSCKRMSQYQFPKSLVPHCDEY